MTRVSSKRLWAAVLGAALAMAACGDDRKGETGVPDPIGSPDGSTDSGTPLADGGTPLPDSGIPDAGPVIPCDSTGETQLRPKVTSSDPAAGPPISTVARDIAISTSLALPKCSGGVDGATLNDTTVTLVRSDGVRVLGTVNTSGGDDTIVFQPTELLSPEATYDFTVTAQVKDNSGQAFIPYTLRFNTSKALVQVPHPQARFQTPVTVFDGSSSGPNGWMPSCTVVVGPDGRLYAAGLDGVIRRWKIAPDGTLTDRQNWEELAGRAVIGMAFHPQTGALFVSHNAPLPYKVRVGNKDVTVYPPDFSGEIARLSVAPGDAFSVQRQDYITGLPRSSKDHLSNSLAFNPVSQKLYLVQGSNTAMGAADDTWQNRPEQLLSAAILEIDPTRTVGLPISVKTAEGGTYDPEAASNALKIYATGIRNAYDLVWHSNGHLYSAANGSAAGGNTPASPAGVIPAVPALIKAPTQDDFLFDVVEKGYYGHPNPLRREYVLNGGNPSATQDFAEVVTSGTNPGYPVGVKPHWNYRKDQVIFDFGRNRSPNGMIEYKSDVFGGALKNRLLVIEFSGGKDILSLQLDAQGNVLNVNNKDEVHLVARFATDSTSSRSPLDLAEQPATGNLFVTTLLKEGNAGGEILLLRPCPPNGAVAPGCQ